MKTNKYIIFSAMGMELVGIMVGCLYIGQLIDEKYQTSGLAMAGLSMLGLAGWLVQIVRLLKKFEEKSE